MVVENFPTSIDSVPTGFAAARRHVGNGKIKVELFSHHWHFSPYLFVETASKTFVVEWVTHSLGPFHFARNDSGIEIWLYRLSITIGNGPAPRAD